jgi:hypothetical protein
VYDVKSEQGVLQDVLGALGPLQPEARKRILRTVLTFFEIEPSGPATSRGELPRQGTDRRPDRNYTFSGHEIQSPKDFLLEKNPRTDVERIVCLGYYLTHYRDMPHFKTADLGKLNTEAAQRKFSNTAYAVNNATQAGFLAPAPRGQKQLSALGEQFVAALPDRDSARAVLERLRPKRQRKRRGKESKTAA